MAAERPITLALAGDVMTGRGIDQILGHPGDPRLVEARIHDARLYVALAEKRHGRVSSPVDPSYIWGDLLSLLERLTPDAVVVNLEIAVTVSDEFCTGADARPDLPSLRDPRLPRGAGSAHARLGWTARA
jgi:poly-gamma-glutamate capsule biosynthesis protein CapA/YwtB (metallophosphatase superfamily)